MAVTITKQRVDVLVSEEGRRYIVGQFQVSGQSNSYVDGGEPVALGAWFKSLFSVKVEKVYGANAVGFMPVIDSTNFVTGSFNLASANGPVAVAGEAKTPDTTDLSTVVVNVTARGWGY